jgi:poly-gamma-glutamate synthesis protein (capsule biosynthesis protein)
MSAGRGRLVAALLVALTTSAACTADDDRAAPAPSPTSSGSLAPSSSDPTTRTPLVVALHPTRPPLDLTVAEVRSLQGGDVTTWSQLGAGSGELRTGTTAEVQVDRDAVAVVPASEVAPPLTVATVEGVDPLRDPSAYPVTTDGPAPPAVTTVMVTGDVMLGRRVGQRLVQVGDPAAALRPMARRLAGADLTIGNLESTLSRAGPPRQGKDSFAAAPAVRSGLELAGFDVLSLANNHTGDFGPQALVETVRRVRAGGFVPVGAGADLTQASRPAVVERNGVRFGVVTFDAIGETPAATPGRPGALRLRMRPRTGPLVPADLDRMTNLVRSLRSQVDVVLVLPHWGTQYTTRTVRDQRLVARALAEAGADVVIGGHPHSVQGMESFGDSLVAYSLGNFVFDMDFSRPTQEGAVLELTFWGSTLKAARLVPVVIGADFAPRVADGPRGQAILERVWDASGPPLTGTHAR